MKAKLAAAVLCAIVGGALPSAVAQVSNPAVADWNEFCWATHGAPAAALERASAAGWDVKPGAKSAYKIAPGDVHSLIAGDNLQTGLPGCMVSAPSKPDAPVHIALRELLGHPPNYKDGPWLVWVFDRNGEAFTWLSNDNEASVEEASANGRVVLVRTVIIGKLDMVEYQAKVKGWRRE